MAFTKAQKEHMRATVAGLVEEFYLSPTYEAATSNFDLDMALLKGLFEAMKAKRAVGIAWCVLPAHLEPDTLSVLQSIEGFEVQLGQDARFPDKLYFNRTPN